MRGWSETRFGQHIPALETWLERVNMYKMVLGLAAASLLSFGMAQSGGGQSGGTDSGGMQSGGAETGNDPVETEPGVAAQSTTGNGLLLVTGRNPGAYLADPEGNTLYTLVNDTAEAKQKLPCEGDCLAVWPPYTGEPILDDAPGNPFDPSLVGTVETADGQTQVTYNGYPLHLYAQDTQPGALAGVAVEGFGGVWYLIGDDGEPYRTDSPTGQ